MRQKGFPRSFKANKTLGYFWLRPSALVSKTEKTQMEKYKLNTILEALNEVPAEFPETKQFIEEHLEQKCFKENVLSKR